MIKEDGAVSISLCILLSALLGVMSMMFLWLEHQKNSAYYIKNNMMTKNYTFDLLQEKIREYQKFKDLWIEDSERAEGKYTFAKAILLEQRVFKDEQNNDIKCELYIFQDSNNIYTLVGDCQIDDITNQICVYLEKKDDKCVVKYWER